MFLLFFNLSFYSSVTDIFDVGRVKSIEDRGGGGRLATRLGLRRFVVGAIWRFVVTCSLIAWLQIFEFWLRVNMRAVDFVERRV